MYFIHCLKVATLSFVLSFLTYNNHVSYSVNKTEIPDKTFEGVIFRIKKGLNYFTDCSIDMLLKNCDQETSVNFECFRSLGECFSVATRAALMDEEHGEKFDDEL